MASMIRRLDLEEQEAVRRHLQSDEHPWQGTAEDPDALLDKLNAETPGAGIQRTAWRSGMDKRT